MFTFNLRRIGILLVLILALIPAAAVASHQFADVPNSNIFHNDIAWMADNGITKGCNPPANTLFCPEDFVKRQQMAAFMHRAHLRFGTRFAAAIGANVRPAAGANTVVTTANITAPAGGGAVTATGNAGITGAGVTQAPAGMLWVEVDNGGRCSRRNVVTIAAPWIAWTDRPAHIVTTGAIGVPAGQHRIDLCTWVDTDKATIVVAELDVTWIANGPTGGNFASFAGDETSDTLSSYIDELEASIVAEAEAR